MNFKKGIAKLFWLYTNEDIDNAVSERTNQLNSELKELDRQASINSTYKRKYDEIKANYAILEIKNKKLTRYFPVNVDKLDYAKYEVNEFDLQWMFKPWKSEVFKNFLIASLANLAKENLTWDSNSRIIAIKYWQLQVIDMWIWLLNQKTILNK